MTDFVHTFLNIRVLIETHRALLIGLETTLKLISLSLLLAMGWGLVLAVARNTRLPFITGFTIFYVDMVRSLPILVLLMLIYYALPFIGISIGNFWAATTALALSGGAYYGEIFRAGIESIHSGQLEASRSLGMTYLQSMVYVVLPQAIKVVLPPLSTNTLEFIKATAVASIVAIPDILRKAQLAQSNTFNPTPLVGALLLYILLCYPLVRLISRFEGR